MKKRSIFAQLCLLGYLGCTGILIVEAAMDGQSSANQSNAVGGTLADFFNDVEGDQTVAIQPTSLSITNKFEVGYVGETYTLETETLPTNATYKALSFTSSNPNVAEIDSKGVITFNAVGNAEIETYNINYPDIKDVFSFEVCNIEAREISSSINDLEPVNDVYTLYLGKEYFINTLFTPANTTNKNLTYEFNSSFLSIDQNGLITPKKYSADNIEEIKIIHNDLSCSLFVKIEYENIVKLDALEISLKNNSIEVGQTLSLGVAIVPSNATFKDYTISSSNNSILKVTGKNIKALKEGEVTLTIQSTTYENINHSINVKVFPQPEIKDFTLQNKTIFVGETASITYTKSPSHAKNPTSITYKSLNTNIATVNNKGVVTGVNPGTTKVEVTINNSLTKTCSITIKSKDPVPGLDFELTVLNNFLNYGKEYNFKDIVKVKSWTPSTPSNTEFSYDLKNNTHGETDGIKVKMLELGEHTLLVTHVASNITKSITIHCVPYDFLLTDEDNNVISSLDLKVKDKTFFKIYDTQDNSTKYQTYEILCSNNNMASITPVNDGYEIEVLDTGSFTINVKAYIDNEVVNIQTINVNSTHNYTTSLLYHLYKNDTEQIDVSDHSVKLYLNSSYTIKPILSKGTTSSKIRYSSDNNIVLRVDGSGKLILNNNGKATITIFDELTNISTYLNVEVFNYISLDPTNPFTIEGENVEHNGDLKYAITNGYSGKITVNFTKESTFKDVTFVSSDTSIASINSDGTITPHKAGKTNITVTCDDGHQNKIEFTIELEVKRQDYIKDLSAFFYKVRKSLGHFSAFLVLGIFSTFTWLLYFDRKKLLFSIPVNYFLGYFIAALTEFIQLYVPGRYGSYADVKLDFEGFCLSATILTIFLIIHNIRKHIFDKKRNI
jgi:uncharacterized protein YjdB